ncbi:MAG: OB-fold domain-containing protein [Burkholderiaceae bacterium]|nr:OB-fold domain-containing protein [Burkholderiaceae bacterium]
MSAYLPPGLAQPQIEADGLTAPYREAAAQGRLMVQKCLHCGAWQWGPEYICHQCHRFDVGWTEVEPRGRIYSWQRVWHPVHAALRGHGPYIVVLAELPQAGNIRMLGNLLGDPLQPVCIGAPVQAVFEHHADAQPSYTLVQWRVTP